MECIRPKYFGKFQCDGRVCDSRCCKGWRVLVDSGTYSKYASITAEFERQEILSQLERLDDKNFFVKMRDNLDCPFLDEDYLCKIQKRHGENYLTAICHSYPRISYNLGGFLEQSLTLTCPIAAKLVLLPTDPIEFETVDIEEPRYVFDWTKRTPLPANEALELQMSAIKILQDRKLMLDERLLNLCLLLNGSDSKIKKIFDVNEASKLMVDIFAEMYNADMSEQKKLNLQSVYINYHAIIFSRLMENYAHIFENYLVNEFFMRCYPFAFEDSLWQNCKIFITGYKAMEFAIILTAISKNGFVTAEEFLNMVDAINEKLDHNRGGMKAIRNFAEKIDDI